MTDIEQKALALLNEVLAERVHWQMTGSRTDNASIEALSRAIEQHEAFRQEVSDEVELSIDRSGHDGLRAGHINEYLGRFIIPKPKPDPLVEIMEGLDGEWTPEDYAKEIRAALKARGFEIREKGE